MTVEFSTKAETLQSLKGVLGSASILPLVYFSVSEWNVNQAACVEVIKSKIGTGPFIVRSSSLHEDGHDVSNAGRYLSILDVSVASLTDAIENVIASYQSRNPDHQVLIQPMLRDLRLSGVAFSHDPNTCAPYRIINWREGSDTTAITGGQSGRTWKKAATSKIEAPVEIEPIVRLIDELLELFNGQPLDCEFAVTTTGAKDQVWLLQARPLILNRPSLSEDQQFEILKDISDGIERNIGRQPFLLGRRTVYSVMSDWNPAEIIGIRPRPLAMSLYRDLITDSVWAYQRSNYGYRNLRSFPLMVHFGGLPYIDVRLSFNSFVPADLDEGLAARLVDYYIDCLVAQPTLHDKVEFEIVFSCFTLDINTRLERLKNAGFTSDECHAIGDSLRNLTQKIVDPKAGVWRADIDRFHKLATRREELYASNAGLVERTYWLLEDCKRYGTLPFAGLARAGFIAVQLLRSLVATGIFSEIDHDSFLSSISTIGKQLARDRAVLDKGSFLSRYGHLRPGTYDVLSPRYDEAANRYFDWSALVEEPKPSRPFAITLDQLRKLDTLLKAEHLDLDPISFLDFIQKGIEYRELSKFHFTRNLSDAMELLVELGHKHGYSRDDISYADASIIKELYVSADDPGDHFARSIDLGRRRYQTTKVISLPAMIAAGQDVWAFEIPQSEPNFITQLRVSGPTAGSDAIVALSGAIVCIPSADPGYDWLFAHPIGGLVTAWGGPNSHMAIRAGELGLPAVIGAGEENYQKWSAARFLSIDCANRRVEILE